MSRAVVRRPRLVVSNPGVQLSLLPATVLEEALPLARQLQLITDVLGATAHREVADELVAILEGPRRPRRIA